MTIPFLGACGSNAPAASGPNAVDESGLPDLYAKAKEEGQVTWWAANLDETQGAAMISAFEKKYPGIKVDALLQTASLAFQRATKDFDSRQYKLDIFGTSDESQCLVLKKKNALAEFLPPIPDSVPAELRSLDPDNTYQASARGMLIISANSRLVGSAPRAWSDLRDPAWANKISLGHPAYSGAMLLGVLGVVNIHGWEFWQEVGGLKPKVNQSVLDTTRDLLSGERLVGMSIESVCYQAKAEGRPLEVVLPTDGAVLQVNPQAVMKYAPHPHAARLFQSFFYSVEAAQVMRDVWKLPLRTDVKPQMNDDLSSVKTVRVRPEDLAEQRDEVKRRWREYMGV